MTSLDFYFKAYNQKVLLKFGDNTGVLFEVESMDSGERYTVSWDIDHGWFCNCPGCIKGGHMCKHILACIEYMKFINMSLLDDPEVYTKEDNVDGGLVGSD